jgi:hypothetical protein
MNKKLFVMVMVPVLVVMSGALAFSAFTGSITTNVSAMSGDLNINQQAFIAQWNSTNTQLGVGATNVTGIETGQMALATDHPYMTSPWTMTSLGWAGAHFGRTITQSVNVSNLAPGNFVVFKFQVTNNGSVGIILSQLSVKPVGTSTGFNVAGSLGGFLGAMSQSSSDTGLYIYANMTTPTDTSIDVGGSAYYTVYVGLAGGSGNSYMSQTLAPMQVTATILSDP